MNRQKSPRPRCATMIMIPKRLKHAVILHLLANYQGGLNAPLLLVLHGPPGEGKTFGLRSILKTLGIKEITLSGGQMESSEAGEPAQMLREAYLRAGREMHPIPTYGENGDGRRIPEEPRPAALVLNDADTGLAHIAHHVVAIRPHVSLLASGR